MKHQTEIINPLTFDDWDEFVLSTGTYSVFHSRSWARVLAETYGYKPNYCILRHKNEHPVAAWPIFETHSLFSGRKGVSLPFSDYCEPILSDDGHFTELFEKLVRHAQLAKWKSIEFRGGQRFFNRHPKATYYNLHLLKLSTQEKEMASRLRNSTRRNIKKAVKKQITVTIQTSLEAVRDFYALNCLTRKHHGLPPQPFGFFKNIYRYLINKGLGMVVLAHHSHKVIAGAVYLHFGKSATYKYGASHRDFLSLRPNNLVMWEAIKWYGQKGFERFDLGRTEPDNRGLNQFKNGWGTTMTPIAYYRYDPVQNIFMENEKSLPPFINHAFRKMPVSVLRILGNVAYRHMA